MRGPNTGDVVLIAHRILSVGNDVAFLEASRPVQTINLHPVPQSDGSIWILTGLGTTEDDARYGTLRGES